MNEDIPTGAGFFGKLQSHGDFISRHLPNGFTATWDNWLQESLAASKNQLAETWLQNYLTSPVWCFALSSNICGKESYAGVLMPSVDNVGRYFPLTIALALPEGFTPFQIQEAGKNGWYEQAEHLALSTLADDFNFETFERELATLKTPLPELLDSKQYYTVGVNNKRAIHVAIPSVSLLEQSYGRLANYLLSTTYANSSLWWTNGSEKVVPSLLVCNGLPPSSGLSAFLDGEWGRWGWREHLDSNVHTA